MYIPSLLNLPSIFLPVPPSTLIEPLFEFSEPYSKFLLAIYFTYGNVSFRVTLSIHLTLSSPLPRPISLFSMSVRTSIQFSIVAALSCTPTNRVGVFQFLDMPANTCLCVRAWYCHKQRHRGMEQNKSLEVNTQHIWSTDPPQACQEYRAGKRVSSTNGVRKTLYPHVKNEIGN